MFLPGPNRGTLSLMKAYTVLPRTILAVLVTVWSVGFVVPSDCACEPNKSNAVSEEDRLGARSDRYSRVFDQAISALVEGDAARFRALLSSTTVLNESRGPGAIDAIISDRFIPFFEGFVELTNSVTTLPTYDAAGNSGLAIARSFTTEGGERKSFVIYIISEKDRMVVGNLLLNMTDKQLLESKKHPPTSDKKK